MNHIIAVIPARMSSQRLPGKPMRLIAGVPMIERVYQQVTLCPGLHEVIVATEDRIIYDFCAAQHIPCQMTDPCPSGTDRLAQVAAHRGYADELYVNVQGDEPLFDPRQMASLLECCRKHGPERETDFGGTLGAATPRREGGMFVVVKPLGPGEDPGPSRNKVVLAADGRCLYFSRALLPFSRDTVFPPTADGKPQEFIKRYQRVGPYAFAPWALQMYAKLGESYLERVEKLEQLRLLEAGVPIYAGITDVDSRPVDTEEDLAAVEAEIRMRA